MNYYLVDAMFGHVGRNKYIIKTVAVLAETAKEAAHKVRWMPRVKHHQKDAIIDVKKAEYNEYIIIKKQNDQDQYFKAMSIQEQRKNCSDLEGEVLVYTEVSPKPKRDKEKVKYKLKKYREYIDSFKYKSMYEEFEEEIDEILI